MDSEKQQQVRSFLLSLKYSTRGWIIVTRPKTQDTMIALGLTENDVKDETLSLSAKDFCEGPVNDEGIKGEVWKFGKVIRGKEVYVKIKLVGDEKGQAVRILSFHFPESPMHYFFK